MGIFFSSSPVEEIQQTPVKGVLSRVKNIFKVHFRGIIGFLVPFVILVILGREKDDHARTTQAAWIWMFCFFLFQPVNVPVTGMIPTFLFPMTGTMSTEKTAVCYFNEGIGLMVLGGIVTLVMNNSEMDRRVAVKLLSYGGTKKFSPTMMIVKCSITSFIMSMLCNRLLTCAVIYELLLPVYESQVEKDERMVKMRDILTTAVQTSSVLGSITIVHAAFPVVAFKTIFFESLRVKDDIFNYLQYFVFSLPVALIMLILCVMFHIALMKWIVKPKVTAEQMNVLRTSFQKYKSDLDPITWRQRLSLVFTIVAILMYFIRWTQWTGYTWATTGTTDATIAAMFVVFLHILPMDLQFARIFSAKKRRDLPKAKPASALLWWKFVDKNTNYGYLLVIGAGVALLEAAMTTGLVKTIQRNTEPHFDLGWEGSVFVVILITTILANIMTGTAVCVMVLPMILCFGATETWKNKIHFGALAVGLASNFGFMTPFRFTPAFQCHNIGKTSWKRMATYSIGCVVICILVLWLALCFYAPAVWTGVTYTEMEQITTTHKSILRTTVQEILESSRNETTNSQGINEFTLNETATEVMYDFISNFFLNRTTSQTSPGPIE